MSRIVSELGLCSVVEYPVHRNLALEACKLHRLPGVADLSSCKLLSMFSAEECAVTLRNARRVVRFKKSRKVHGWQGGMASDFRRSGLLDGAKIKSVELILEGSKIVLP